MPEPVAEHARPQGGAEGSDATYTDAQQNLIQKLRAQGIKDPGVLAALRQVPRHHFVGEAQLKSAYENRPLAIGNGQTISQPYIVALMTELLRLKPTERVLEIGTGCGYQTAILCELAGEVYSIEIIRELGWAAKTRLKELGYNNLQTRIGNGCEGWSESAPFDAIILTAAPETVPGELIEQLKPGGRMVIPIGAEGADQDLLLIEKDAAGNTTERNVIPVRFVPITRTIRRE